MTHQPGRCLRSTRRGTKRVSSKSSTTRAVGLAFFGKRPPVGHAEDPEKLSHVAHSIPSGLYEPRPGQGRMAVEVEVVLLDAVCARLKTGRRWLRT